MNTRVFEIVKRRLTKMLGLSILVGSLTFGTMSGCVSVHVIKAHAATAPTKTKIVDVAAGVDHNLALDSNGYLWAWGRNDQGQLGDGTTTNAVHPIQIFRGHKFKSISAGNQCSAAIDEDGYLYGWGGAYNPTKAQVSVPTLVSGADHYSSVHCSYDCTFSTLAGDSKRHFGYAYDRWSTDTFTEKGNSRLYVVSTTSYYAGPNGIVTYEKGIKSIDCDYYRSGSRTPMSSILIIDLSGNVTHLSTASVSSETSYRFLPRSLDFSLLGDVSLDQVAMRKTIEVTTDYQPNYTSTAYLLSESGDIYSVGGNASGNYLGNGEYGTSSYISTPVKVDSSVKFTKVAAGGSHALAISDDGLVYSWGDNGYGQLGTNDYNGRSKPVLISTFDEAQEINITAAIGESNPGSFAMTGGSNYAVSFAPSKGTLTVNASTGEYTYVTNSGAAGYDVASITVDYSGLTVTYDVNIHLNNKPVFIGGNSSFSLECNQTYNGVAPARDADGDPLAYSIMTQPSKGTVTVDSSTGAYTYVSLNDVAGADSFVISVSDGYSSVQYPVSVHVNSLITASGKTEFNLDLNVTDTISGNVQASDIDGDALTYSITKNGGKGSVSVDSDGNFTYKANGNSFGADTFIVKIDDGYKPLEVEHTVHIYKVNDCGTSLLAKITKGSTYEGRILTDANGATPVYSIVDTPSRGNINISSDDGAYTYVPNEGTSGDDSFSVLVDYSYSRYTLTIHIYQNSLPNDASVVTSFVTPMNTNYSGSAGCVDLDGDSLRYTLVGNPSKGTISLDVNTGAYIYYPNDGVAGDDCFRILVNDGTDSIVVFVSVHIESEIEVTSSIGHKISQNTSASGNINASDKDGDALLYSLKQNASHGIANVDSSTGDYTYLPLSNYCGDDCFVIEVDDGVLKKEVKVNVFVNRRPVADRILINLTAKGNTVNGTATCNDPDGDALLYTIASAPSQGTVIINSSNGLFAYTPYEGAHGDDSFVISSSDGQDDMLITVTVHNETDVALDEDSKNYVANRGKTTSGQVFATDLDGDELTYSVGIAPNKGRVNLNFNTGAWTYMANADASGRDSFTIVVSDGQSSKTMTCNMAINTPPEFNEDSYSFVTEQNTAYTAVVSASDADGDALIYNVVSQGTKGTVSVGESSGRYYYVPNENAAGDDSFIIGVSDGNYTSEVLVSAHIESDIVLPSTSITISVDKGAVATGELNATDPDGDLLSYSIYQKAEKGEATVTGKGTFLYFANAGAGDDSFVVSISDGVHTSYVTVYVHVSTKPTAEQSEVAVTVPFGGSYSGKIGANDEDGDALTYQISTSPKNGTVNLNSKTGEYIYTPFAKGGFNDDSFVVSVSDGTNVAYVTVKVVINNKPSAQETSLTVAQGGSGTGSISASDPEGDALAYSISANATHGTASIDSSTGKFTYVCADSSYSGHDFFTVRISDGFNTIEVAVNVNVVKNEKPVAHGTSISTSSGTEVSGKLNAADNENDPLTYSISCQGDKGVATIDEDTGVFHYVAKENASGYDCFVVTISDGFNTVSYLVEVNITFVDAYRSWAIPTTIAVGSVAVAASAGLAFVVVKNRRKGK